MTQQTINLQSSGTLIENPFSVTFSWQYNSITVRLKNGEDVLKLANIFSNMLTENGIENTIETSELKIQLSMKSKKLTMVLVPISMILFWILIYLITK